MHIFKKLLILIIIIITFYIIINLFKQRSENRKAAEAEMKKVVKKEGFTLVPSISTTANPEEEVKQLSSNGVTIQAIPSTRFAST